MKQKRGNLEIETEAELRWQRRLDGTNRCRRQRGGEINSIQTSFLRTFALNGFANERSFAAISATQPGPRQPETATGRQLPHRGRTYLWRLALICSLSISFEPKFRAREDPFELSIHSSGLLNSWSKLA